MNEEEREFREEEVANEVREELEDRDLHAELEDGEGFPQISTQGYLLGRQLGLFD